MQPSPFVRRILLFLTCFVVAFGVSLTGILAATAPRAERRFEGFVKARDGAVIAVAPRNVDELASADPLRARWDAFRQRHAGRWTVYVDERSAMPTLVSGRGIELIPADAFEDATLDEIEASVRAFLVANRELLGDWTEILELDTDASVELRPGHRQLVFRQSVDDVTVENSRFDFHLVDGKLTMFGASHWGVPTTSGVAKVDADDARDLLDAYLGRDMAGLESVEDASLVLVARDGDPFADRPKKWSGPRGAGLAHVLIWRLKFRDPESPALWVGEVDAHDGKVLAFYDGAQYHSIRGGVIPAAPDVGCNSGGCEIEGFPMPFADWTESGQVTASADSYGNLSCVDPGATFETSLTAQYAWIDDNCGAILETGSCEDGLRLGVRAGENCDVAPGTSPGNTAAARSSFYHVNRVAEVARYYNPGNAYLNEPVAIHTNWNQTCNASYSAENIYLYRSGTSWAECANSGEIQGIIVHEWGHGYDDNDGGGWDLTSEAYGDVVSMLASRESCFGPGLFTDGRVCWGYGDACLTCTGFRDHDWTAREANTPATPQDFVQNNCLDVVGDSPCGGSVHCESYPIGESIFDLPTRGR